MSGLQMIHKAEADAAFVEIGRMAGELQEARSELARVKQERDKWKSQLDRQCQKLTDIEEYGQVPARLCLEAQAERNEARRERDTALQHLEAVLAWTNSERFDGRTRHEGDAPFLARAFLLSMREKADGR